MDGDVGLPRLLLLLLLLASRPLTGWRFVRRRMRSARRAGWTRVGLAEDALHRAWEEAAHVALGCWWARASQKRRQVERVYARDG